MFTAPLRARTLSAFRHVTKSGSVPTIVAAVRTCNVPLNFRFKSTVAEVAQVEDVVKCKYMGKTGGEIIHDLLAEHNVDTVFGYPGGAILPVLDAIYESPHFKFILPRHEQGGAHMAQGYARVTGKPGVVIVTSGPGGTNTLTAMQDALMDGTPLVVLTGQVPRIMQGTDAFQEADIVGMSRSCTKWNVTVKSIKDLPKYIHRAFDVATSGRPGPVLVDLPKDITAGILTEPVSQGFKQSPRLKNKIRAHHLMKFGQGLVIDTITQEQVLRIANKINNSKRPVIYAGQGVIQSPGGTELLRRLAEETNIPVTTTLQGMGAFDELHPLSLRMLGMHGSAYANYAIQASDCLIALGARFDDRVTGNLAGFAPMARGSDGGSIIHFDVSVKNINKVVEVDEAVVGDLTKNLSLIEPHLKYSPRTEWMKTIEEWKQEFPFNYNPSKPGEPLKPQAAIEAFYNEIKDRTEDVIVTTGVGAHQMWAAQYYRWRHPSTFITSGGSGTMGFGLPAAIGAQVGQPNKIVVDIDGDASLSMTYMEFVTACQYNIPVKILLLNNDFQGMVKQWQDLFYDERYSHTEMYNPDFVKMAEAMGGKGLKVSTQEELGPKMKEFIDHKGPIILEVKVCKKEHVYPMVPAGKALHEMVMGPSP